MGGHGEVWEGSTAAHGVPVAIKLLPPGLPTSGGLPSEVAILASLRHPGVVRLLDAGVVEDPLPGIPVGSMWLAMEKVAGRALAHAGLESGSRSLLMVLYQLLDALAYIHSRGYVHGDLSPANVLWSVRDWRVKVVDFGVAQPAGAGVGPTLGTPGFLAPERRRGAPLSPTTDLYSLGRLGLYLLQHNPQGMVGLHGIPMDRMATWLQGLSAEEPGLRPPRAAEARAWLAELVGARPVLHVLPSRPDPSEPSSTHPVAPTGVVQTTVSTPPTGSQPTGHGTGSRPRAPERPVPPQWSGISIPVPATVPGPPASLELGWMAAGTSVFAARGSILTGRDDVRAQLWQALIESAERGMVLRLDGPPGVGVSRLLEEVGQAADETGLATVVRSPERVQTHRRTVLWLFDEPTATQVAFAQRPFARGLILLGRGPEVGERIPIEPLPPALRAALVRSMLPVNADVAGWIALRSGGRPGASRALLLSLMNEGRLVLEDRRYGWADGMRPEPDPLDIPEQLGLAFGEYETAANDQAWSRACDIASTKALSPGEPLHTRWLDLVGNLADRLPRDVPLDMLTEPVQPGEDRSSVPAQAHYQRGVRAIRRENHSDARQHFLAYLDGVDTPAERALGIWQLGAVAFGENDLLEARRRFTEAHGLLMDGCDPVRLAHTMLALSLVESNLGLFSEALTWAARATEAFEAIGKPRHRANIADFESSCHLWLGELELAEARARESLARYADDGSPNRLFPLLNLAAALHHQGRSELVREILDEVARRAGVEAPALLGVVALYGALFAAQEGEAEVWDQHWEGFEEVWASGARWHPATSRMLFDIGCLLRDRGWDARLAQLSARLQSLRDHLGEAVVARFGVGTL